MYFQRMTITVLSFYKIEVKIVNIFYLLNDVYFVFFHEVHAAHSNSNKLRWIFSYQRIIITLSIYCNIE